jgi:hypothetical protein
MAKQVKVETTVKGNVKITLSVEQAKHLRTIVGNSSENPTIEATAWDIHRAFDDYEWPPTK